MEIFATNNRDKG